MLAFRRSRDLAVCVPKLMFYIIDEEHGAFENMYFHPKKGKIDIDVIKQYIN